MSFKYTKTATTVERMLKQFGTSATLMQTSSVYDPETGLATLTSSQQEITATAMQSERSYIDNSLIAEGRRGFLVSPIGLAVAPKVGDVLVWMGASLKVEKVGTLSPAGIAVLHEVQVRG